MFVYKNEIRKKLLRFNGWMLNIPEWKMLHEVCES